MFLLLLRFADVYRLQRLMPATDYMFQLAIVICITCAVNVYYYYFYCYRYCYRYDHFYCYRYDYYKYYRYLILSMEILVMLPSQLYSTCVYTISKTKEILNRIHLRRECDFTQTVTLK